MEQRYPLLKPLYQQRLVDREVLVESFIDITDKKKSEQALHESEELYKSLAEASPDLIFIIDKKDRICYLNASALRQIGLSQEEIIGKPRNEFFPPEISKYQKQALQLIFDTGEPFHRVGPLAFEGKTFWFDHYLIPLHDDQGGVIRVLGISRDITDIKNAEVTLRESEERFKTLFEKSGEVQLLLDDMGKCIDCNAAFLTLFAITDKEEIRGHSPSDFAPEFQPDGISLARAWPGGYCLGKEGRDSNV